MTLNQLLDALGRHVWSCVYDKEQHAWCLWYDGKNVLTSSRANVMTYMRAVLGR